MKGLTQLTTEVQPYTREQIVRLEEVMKEMPQIDGEQYTKHHFAPGVYVRELFIPEGVVITGKIHRHQLMNVLASGVVRMTTDDGIETLVGPKIFSSKPGSKNAW